MSGARCELGKIIFWNQEVDLMNWELWTHLWSTWIPQEDDAASSPVTDSRGLLLFMGYGLGAEKTLEPFRTHPKLQSPTCFFHFRLPGIWFFPDYRQFQMGKKRLQKSNSQAVIFRYVKVTPFANLPTLSNIDSQNASVFCWKEMWKVPKTPSIFL